MAITVAKYTFGSWLRKGIAANINEVDNLGVGASPVKERATIPVDIAVNAQAVHKDFSLLGPGDIVGINPKLVVRTEPANWITDFEPNYFPCIEFYDEDLAWRYTPAKANGDKLRPWMVLIVLKESDNDDEQEFTKQDKRMPLPTVTVKSGASLPPNTETWAWSHVQTNDSYETDSEFEEFLQSLHNLNDPNADKIICRLISPRRLDPNSAYRAFVVPSFETGRMAGLDQDVSEIDAQQPSWTSDGVNIEFPVYYEWYFRTGENEDFESLVKLLEPRAIDSRVGIRDMDGSKPGFGLTIGTDIGAIVPSDQNQEIIGLEGALKSPSSLPRPENIDVSKEFLSRLEDIVNFPAELKKVSNTSIDPVVSPPIYGQNHAMKDELNIHDSSWLHALNKDPRMRVPSGFGTNVIQKNQEAYTSRAWEQVQEIIEANKKIRWAAFAMTFATKVKENFIEKLSPTTMITFFSPLLKKVKGSPTTLYTQLKESNIPTTVVSAPFRRIMRPRGVFYRKLKKAHGDYSHERLLNDLNEGKISPAPPKKTPEGLDTLPKFNKNIELSLFMKWLVKYSLILLIIVLVICFVLAILGCWKVAIAMAVVGILLYLYIRKRGKPSNQGEIMEDPEKLVKQLEETQPRPDFVFTETDPVVKPASSGNTTVTQSTGTSSGGADRFTYETYTYATSSPGGGDSLEARNFREAAIKLNTRLSLRAEDPVRAPFDLGNAQIKLSTAVDPRIIFPKQLATLVYFSFNPLWLLQPEKLVPAMAYPDFEDPMYEKLRDISTELLIPNLNLIEPNTISLMETNPPFIESYMVGLNHEFGKELLWREYPTDTRGSYFRQFWDTKGIINNESGLSQEELTEKYKDITPLDEWTNLSKLGTHNNRNIHGDKQVVLVVRGDLFKKYPNTIVYAQKAKIYRTSDGVIDGTREPVISEVQTEQQMADEIKFPIFLSEIEPDFKFFGFDLTVEAAKGDDDPQVESDDWGYYFVIQQIPGDPRFGMDVSYEPSDDDTIPVTWDDMSWEKYDNGELFVKTSVVPEAGFEPEGAGESRSQWGADAATMAYILYQKPVMIAVHAKEMLNDL